MTDLSRRTVLGGIAGAAAIPGLPAGTAIAGGAGAVRAVRLTTGHLTDPLGIGLGAPRFGWQLRADGIGRAQSAYRIVVGTTADAADVWDSGKVDSSEQTGRRYDGPALRPRTRYHWAAQVWDERGRPGPLSRPAWFETALAGDDWQAEWIGSGIVVPKPTRVLPPGQLEPVPLTAGHTLGQSFGSDSPLAAVVVLFEVANGVAATTMTLHRDGPTGAVVATRRLTGLTGDAYGTAQGRLDLTEPAAPGRYYVELSDIDGELGWSGTKYRQPRPDGTYADDVYPDGSAFADRKAVLAEDRWLSVIPPAPPANPLLRKDFRLPGRIVSARLYLSGLGHGEAWINGRRVGDDVLAPVATDYDKRVLYVTHDVTDLLRPGANALGVALGRGFFGTRAPDSDGSNLAAWIAEPQLKAQLEVTLAGGRRIVLASGSDWHLTDGPTSYEGLHAGESYDARRAAELDGWSEPGFGAIGWQRTVVVKDPGGRLEPYPGEHLRTDPPIEPVRVTTPAPGVRVYDFGVVLSGWVRLSIGRLAPGTVVRLVYGEKLDQDGRVLVGTAGGAENPAIDGRWQIDEYTATGGRQSWQPRFSYKGFQYVEVTGGEVELEAIGVGSDVADTMELRLEHPELQWIADAFRRTAWNGLFGYPNINPFSMVGWFGAARNAVQPMLYQFGLARLFEHWLEDIRLAQAPSGAIPVIAPFGGPAGEFMFTPVYVSLYPHLVHRHWVAYADRSVPERHYDAVWRCLEWMLSQLQDDLVAEEVFGDWYPPGVALGEHPRGPEGGRLVGSAFVIQAVRDGLALAELLGKPEAVAWRTRVSRMTARFNAEFLDTRAGIYRTEVTTAGYRQASNAIPLALGLTPAQHVRTVVAHLAADVEAKDRHLDTGSMGTGALPYALSDHDRGDLAVAVLGQTSYPGYGALRRMGATTFWESWEPHARVHNDPTIGNPAQWLVERAAGVEPLAPGWSRFRVRPRVTDSLPGASIALDTVRGRIEARWQRRGGRLTISVRVPVNAVAELVLPDGRARELGSGHHRVTV